VIWASDAGSVSAASDLSQDRLVTLGRRSVVVSPTLPA
jgi:hypothetical protein